MYDEFEKTIQFLGDKYSVRLPWKPEIPIIPDNYKLAAGRLSSTLRRLRKNESHLKEYERIINEQLSKGIIEECHP